MQVMKRCACMFFHKDTACYTMYIYMFEIESIIFLLFFFSLGIAVGSFLNVVILRHERGEKITGRSHCNHCNKKLSYTELIPLVSYVLQQGRCRACGATLSKQYPLVESITGVLFMCIAYKVFGGFSFGPVLVFSKIISFGIEATLWSLLTVITVYDMHTKRIPDIFSYSFAVIAFLYIFIQSFFGGAPVTFTHILAGPILFSPFYLLWKISDGRWIGLGDGKLALGMGWFLGLFLGGTAVLFSFWLGAAISLLLIGIQKGLAYQTQYDEDTAKTLSLKSEIPFGPFLVLGTLIIYLFEYNIFTELLF